MALPPQSESLPARSFVYEPSPELGAATMQRRWQHVNVIIRLAMLTGSQMQLEPSLKLLCELAQEIVAYSAARIYFWNEVEETMELRLKRGAIKAEGRATGRGSSLNFWAGQFAKPLMVKKGVDSVADAELAAADADSALVIPLFVRGRVLGSMQLFSPDPDGFEPEDAQLLWTLSLVADNLLTREQANEGLLRFAFTDYLTGLRTRGYFEQQLELEFKRSERKDTGFALLMVDIDYFKQLNDRYGHHVGDKVLREVTALLATDMREVDTVARYGGEEFVIVLPETSEIEAIYVAQRLRKAVQQARFHVEPGLAGQQLTISIGIAMFPQDAQSRRGLIEAADVALYAAKKSGRNQVLTYSRVITKEQGQNKVS
jgi:diguanylate cyclase (GGDEF)-like protein